MRRAALILLGLAFPTASAAWADEQTHKRATDFAQKFYDWYVPIALKPGKTAGSDVAVAKRGALFDPPLLRALRADSEAQAKVPDDIVGLDFGPFLNAQDPDSKYVVGEVSEKDGLYGLRKGKREKDVSVVAELKPSKDSFVFVNFAYGADGDLVAVLKSLADDRAHPTQP